MNREFVSYEEALALKELGFNEPCFTTYDLECRLRNPFDYAKSEYGGNAPYIEDTKEWVHNSDLTIKNFNGPSHLYTQYITAPLYQQAFRWFRDKHAVNNCIAYSRLEDNSWFYQYDRSGLVGGFNTYEEAQIACLKKLIELVKNKALNN
jgi:hypothetical protein